METPREIVNATKHSKLSKFHFVVRRARFNLTADFVPL